MAQTPNIIDNAEDQKSPILSLSPKQIQAFYNAITGHKEELSRYYDDLYQVELCDIENLHLKLQQTLEQYSVCAKSLNVKVFFDNDQKESFSSFERFKAQNLSEARCTEAVVLKYNFLIKLPDIERTQEYEILVRVASNVVVIKQMHNDLPSHMWDAVKYKNGYVNIEYVDYAVARNFLATIQEWFDGLKVYKPGKTITVMKKWANKLPSITKLCFPAITAIYFSKTAQTFNATIPNKDIVSFQLLSFTAIFLTYQLGLMFGNIARDSIGRHVFPSYVHLTKGDERRIKELIKENNNNKLLSTLKIVCNIVLSIGCSVVASYIYSSLASQ